MWWWIHKWRRYWTAIDLIGLGGGGTLAIWFYVSNARAGVSQASVALDTFWANVATEIVGVWLSVRIIDAVVRRHDRRIARRQQIAAELQYIAARSAAVLEDDVDALNDLREAVESIDEPNTERKVALSEREQTLVERALRPARELCRVGVDLLGLHRVVDQELNALPNDELKRIREEMFVAPTVAWENVFTLRQLVETERATASDATRYVLSDVLELVRIAAQYRRTLNELRHWQEIARNWLVRV